MSLPELPGPAQQAEPFKLGRFEAGEVVDAVRHRWPHVWFRQTTSASERLLIAPRDGHVALLAALAGHLKEPFRVLYVHLVPRGGGVAAGRHASEEMGLEELRGFLGRYAEFFERDGRHHVWVASPSTGATLVYDQHDWIYAYGSLPAFEETLRDRGLRLEPGPFGGAESPHSHHYHAAFDKTLDLMMGELEWSASPLRAGDES